MTLPGNRVPLHGEPQPVYGRDGTRWSWDPERMLYICDDPDYSGPPCTSAGAIPEEFQPVRAHPPSLREQIADELHPDAR